MDILKKLQETLHYIKNQGVDNAEVGIVLGTGLGAMVNEIEVIKEIPYGDIPHFPIATVEFHSGKQNLQGYRRLACLYKSQCLARHADHDPQTWWPLRQPSP